jgi:hypothetical protein
MGGQVGEGGTLQTDAAHLYLFVPIPAKAKKLGLLSIYIFSLIRLIRSVMTNWRLGNFFYVILKGLHHKISKKPIVAA